MTFEVDPNWRVNLAKRRIQQSTEKFFRAYKDPTCPRCGAVFASKRDLWKHRARCKPDK